jgi:4-hydroxymandelate oxidase
MVDDVTDGPSGQPLAPLDAIPPDLLTLADYEARAEAHMPAASWRHVQEGSGREITLRDNRAAFDRWRLLPRALADLRGGNTALDLFGRRHAAPILLAPIAYECLAHPEGERAMVRAAAALEAGVALSTLSSVPMEEVAAAAAEAAAALGTGGAPLWFQLYLQEDRAHSAELIRRAEASGYEAIVLTIDTAVKRSSFTLPAGVDAANLRGMPKLQHTSTPGGRILFGTALADAAPRWEDLAWVRACTTLPLIVKGILTPDDARRAVDHGADGIVVSNHGGRVLDGLPAAIDVLPAIVEAVAGDVPLLVDGGVRTGTDIVKALALGAAAVLVGRPQIHGLAVAGMPGVAHVIHILRAELEMAMAQMGCPALSHLGRAQLWYPRPA